ncbi:hypothetical protein CEXT_488441 [Caerostris extrusa]|uniref:Uncharacterized protein n=1 Tax=Caerostris extrusa TaxID=172846 RepID=A0AAV4RS88_CAEEX|nr:hypothetical protein CEXT_488441 [Caerostris extrusa]
MYIKNFPAISFLLKWKEEVFLRRPVQKRILAPGRREHALKRRFMAFFSSQWSRKWSRKRTENRSSGVKTCLDGNKWTATHRLLRKFFFHTHLDYSTSQIRRLVLFKMSLQSQYIKISTD